MKLKVIARVQDPELKDKHSLLKEVGRKVYEYFSLLINKSLFVWEPIFPLGSLGFRILALPFVSLVISGKMLITYLIHIQMAPQICR